jgi:type II secretory ATPase GspE/PulE/Tfp pilus assembly ATPase PilB-like protein
MNWPASHLLVNLVNLIILGIESRASDVHIEPFESKVRINTRIDGMLRNPASECRRPSYPVSRLWVE